MGGAINFAHPTSGEHLFYAIGVIENSSGRDAVAT